MVSLAPAILSRCRSWRKSRVVAAGSFLAERQRATATAKNPKLAGTENVRGVDTSAERTAELDRLRRLRHQSERSAHSSRPDPSGPPRISDELTDVDCKR